MLVLLAAAEDRWVVYPLIYRFVGHCCLYLAIFGETIDHSPCVSTPVLLTNMRHLTALILGVLALIQTSSSSSYPSTYTPTPATDPNAQLDHVYNFAYNVAMENLGSNCTRDKIRIRREWYVNRHLPKPLL